LKKKQGKKKKNVRRFFQFVGRFMRESASSGEASS